MRTSFFLILNFPGSLGIMKTILYVFISFLRLQISIVKFNLAEINTLKLLVTYIIFRIEKNANYQIDDERIFVIRFVNKLPVEF